MQLGNLKIGTTGRGIGPSYSTKAARSGVRVIDIFNEETFERRVRQLADGYKKRFGDLLQYDVEVELSKFRERRKELHPFVVDAVQFMSKYTGKKILIEGANGESVLRLVLGVC
jgi:adenylosuccinate synthase